MNELLAHLRALDPKRFELLIFHLLKARYPNADVKHINGDAGDQGLDVFAGQLNGQATIWQCKAFANGVKDSQKQQIRDSLNAALKYHPPRRWILCLSIDLDAKTMRWFQNLTQSKAHLTEVMLEQGSDSVHQLMYEHTIRESFFPNITINTVMVREHLKRTDALTTEELADLTDDTNQTYLARLQANDQRFSYSITHTRDTTPVIASGTIASITNGTRTVNVLGRDLTALRLDPPTFQLSLTELGEKKLREFTSTGRSQVFTGPDDITDFATPFDFLLPPLAERNSVQLEVGCIPTLKVPLRVTFGRDNPVVYEYLEFKCTSLGGHLKTGQ